MSSQATVQVSNIFLSVVASDQWPKTQFQSIQETVDCILFSPASCEY